MADAREKNVYLAKYAFWKFHQNDAQIVAIDAKFQFWSSKTGEFCIFFEKNRLAEQAERYDEMAKYMEQVTFF